MFVTTSGSPEQRYELGRSLRKQVPLESHGHWSAGKNRPDPVTLIEEQNQDRLAWLLPVRRARMLQSPFTFFRGSARIMAADLVNTPISGLKTQICGDAHLANFGAYASPERRLVVDLNDFDETLPGPWEWDVKRLCVSIFIAARHNGFSKKEARRVTGKCVRSYRKGMKELSKKRFTDVWYSMVEVDQMIDAIAHRKTREAFTALATKAMSKDSMHALDRLAEEVGEKFHIRDEPPLLIPFRKLQVSAGAFAELRDLMRNFKVYLKSLPNDCAHLVQRYRPVDFAIKVVGVGSVGTRCYILLLEGRDRQDPLFLQIKQALPSVLEEHLGPSCYATSGQRVVEGQRLMQTVTDIFLGHGVDASTGNHYYWRQLRDWKGSPKLEDVHLKQLNEMATIRGWTLARAHARAGDPCAISGYMDDGKTFDIAIVRFSETYAEQSLQDFNTYTAAIYSRQLIVAKLGD